MFIKSDIGICFPMLFYPKRNAQAHTRTLMTHALEVPPLNKKEMATKTELKNRTDGVIK